jgi:hypothetical protein
MAARIIAELGPWLWMVAGFALFALEALAPRGLALALGIGAILTGATVITLQFSALPVSALWQQGVLFGVLSLGAHRVARRVLA